MMMLDQGERAILGKGHFHLFENRHITLGWTERGVRITDLKWIFHSFDFLQLTQIHSNRIFLAEKLNPGSEGDGIILNQKKRLAIIKTADCIPLFFWNEKLDWAGIIHVGWRGLWHDIQTILVNQLRQLSGRLDSFTFFIGPAIENRCYQVGGDLYKKFEQKLYRDKIFSPISQNRYLMDLKAGLKYSLIESGVAEERIKDIKLCTRCHPEFPSYRRDGKSEERIYNFVALT